METSTFELNSAGEKCVRFTDTTGHTHIAVVGSELSNTAAIDAARAGCARAVQMATSSDE